MVLTYNICFIQFFKVFQPIIELKTFEHFVNFTFFVVFVVIKIEIFRISLKIFIKVRVHKYLFNVGKKQKSSVTVFSHTHLKFAITRHTHTCDLY